jgi:hypothetical protein
MFGKKRRIFQVLGYPTVYPVKCISLNLTLGTQRSRLKLSDTVRTGELSAPGRLYRNSQDRLAPQAARVRHGDYTARDGNAFPIKSRAPQSV